MPSTMLSSPISSAIESEETLAYDGSSSKPQRDNGSCIGGLEIRLTYLIKDDHTVLFIPLLKLPPGLDRGDLVRVANEWHRFGTRRHLLVFGRGKQ